MQTKSLQMKRALRAALLVLLLSAAGMGKGYAQNFNFDNLNYTVNRDGMSVTLNGRAQGTFPSGSLEIPEYVTYNDNIYPVTAIGNEAFSHSSCNGFTGTLTIPSSIIYMEWNAFSGCTNFEQIIVAPGNTIFDSRDSCNAIIETYSNTLIKGCKNTIIPNTVTSIGFCAFYDCSGLVGELVIPNSVTEIGGAAFANCSGLVGGLVIPNSVTEIGGAAFANCSGITSISIPNSVKSIGIRVFEGTGWYESQHDGILYMDNWCLGYKGEKPTGTLALNGNTKCIADGAFASCTGLIGSLTIPNSVTAIGSTAFYGCSGFSGSLSIPNSVTAIGSSAFYSCSGFTGSLTIGNSVTEIGSFAFYNCAGFTGNLRIPNSVITIYNWAFNGCSGFTGNLVISNSVTTIGDGAFENCSGLNSINIPNSVSLIGYGAFNGTGWYETQPDGLLYLDNWCLGYKGEKPTGPLVLDGNTRGIAYGAFSFCSGLTGSLTIPNSVIAIGGEAFNGCSGFTGSLTIPNSVTTIDGYAFKGCTGFTGSLTIGNSVTSIGNSAFYNCSGFSGNLTIPNSVTKIGGRAFYNCSGFSGELNISDSVTTIDDYIFVDGLLFLQNDEGTFENCSGFTSIVIGNSLKKIGPKAFRGCSGFKGNLTIPDSVTSIGWSAFYGCSGFTGNLTIGNSVKKIGGWAFYNCNGFTGNLTIGNSLTQIGLMAFKGCSGFTGSLTLPDTVIGIGESAFSGCSGFTRELYLGNSVSYIGSNAFFSYGGLTSVEIPNTTIEVGEHAFSNCGGLTSIIIGESVKFIGNEAIANNPRLNMVYYNVKKDLEAPTNVFDNCPNLTTIHIGPDVQEIGSNIFKGCNTVHFVVALGPTPALLDAGAFSDIVDNSMLMVSCGKRVTYYSVWNMFPFNNIIEDCNQYPVSVGVVGTGGNVTVSSTEVQMGQTVTITVTPNAGMILVSLTVVNANDPTQIIPVSPTGKGASNYSFVMPPFGVVVMATFKPSGTSVVENSSIEVSVYPNPTSGHVKIEAEDLKHISINNMLGQQIYNGKAAGNEFEYDFGKHGAGLYLIRIETANGMVVKKVSVR